MPAHCQVSGISGYFNWLSSSNKLSQVSRSWPVLGFLFVMHFYKEEENMYVITTLTEVFCVAVLMINGVSCHCRTGSRGKKQKYSRPISLSSGRFAVVFSIHPLDSLRFSFLLTPPDRPVPLHTCSHLPSPQLSVLPLPPASRFLFRHLPGSFPAHTLQVHLSSNFAFLLSVFVSGSVT